MAEAAPKSGEFSEGRLWFRRKGSVLTIGMTSHAIEILGALQTFGLPEEGEECQKGEVLTTVEGSGGSLEIVSPISGAIHEVNTALEEEPEIASEDPLEEGWLLKIQIEDQSELQDLVEDQDYNEEEEE